MVMVQEKDVKKYLTDLGERLKHVNTDLADIISSEAEYLSFKIEKGLFSDLFVGSSGFPSAPSLKADLKYIYESSKRYDRKAKKIVDKLKSGNVGGQNELSMNMGTIYVPTNVLEGFIGVSVKKVTDNYSLISTKTIEEKKDEWFYLTEQNKKVKDLQEVEGLGISLIENSDELAAIAGTTAGFFLLGPLGLAVYPAWMALKYSQNKKKKHYLLKDFYTLVKKKVKNPKKLSEKKIKNSPDSTKIEQFKFFHPLIDDDLNEPILLYKNKNGEVNIVDKEGSDLEKELNRGVNTNKQLKKRLGVITSLGGRLRSSSGNFISTEGGFGLSEEYTSEYKAVSGFKHKKEITKIMDVLEQEKEKINLTPELYKLNEEQINDIGQILEKYLLSISKHDSIKKDKIVKPSEAFVDKLGSLYPSLPFWTIEHHLLDSEKALEFNELFMDYLKNDSTTPLTTFLKNEKLTDLVLRSMEDSLIPAMYVFVNKDQFSLNPPEQIYDKLDSFTGINELDQKVSKHLDLKRNLSETIGPLCKKPHFKNLFANVSMIELEKTGSTSGYHGSLKDIADLNESINEKLRIFESNVQEGKYSPAQVQERTKEITTLQKKMIQTYGKIAPEAINELRKVSNKN